MPQSLLVIHTFPKISYCLNEDIHTILDVKEKCIPQIIRNNGFYLSCNNHHVEDNNLIEYGKVYHCTPRLVGGKGGFGSMLRAIGAQIEKTTSREACRDLSGRRMRDVNNEKKLKDWLSKHADREREKEERRQAKLAKRHDEHKHNFDDPSYVEQKSRVSDDLKDALKTGLQSDAAGASATVTRSDIRGKRKADSKCLMKAKKRNAWLGIDVDLDDLSSDSSDGGSSSDGGLRPLVPSSQGGEGNSEGGEENSRTHSESMDCEAGTSSKNSGQLKSKPCDSGNGNRTGQDADSSKDTNADIKHNVITTEISSTNAKQSPREESGENSLKEEQKDEKSTTSSDTKSSLLSLLPPPAVKEESKEVNLEDVDLDSYSSVGELEALGMDRLKFTLTRRGIKCGGTLEERAERLFSIKGLTRDQIDPSLFPKGGKGKKK